MAFGRQLKIHFGDGVIRKVFNVSSNPQTGLERVWYRRRFKKIEQNMERARIGIDYVEVPKQAIVGDPSGMIRKKYTYDCWSYDSFGNPIPEERSSIISVVKENILLNKQISSKNEHIMTLEAELDNLRNSTRKDTVIAAAADIKRFAEASASALPRVRAPKGGWQNMPMDYPQQQNTNEEDEQ